MKFPDRATTEADPSLEFGSASQSCVKLNQKVAIITGSARGIGREMAVRFAAEGACVVVADLDVEQAHAVVDLLSTAGHVAHAVDVDVTQPQRIEAAIEETVKRFGRLDIFVNNAGIGLNKLFLETTLAEWEQQLRVNLTGTFLCAQAAARVMVRQGYGRIINIASIPGQRGGSGAQLTARPKRASSC